MRFAHSQFLLATLLSVTVACGGGDNEPSSATGTVTGTVRRSGNAAPLAGINVAVGSVRTTSGADGTFTLAGVPTGTRTLSAAAAGYSPYSAQVSVTAAGTTQDIDLLPLTLFTSDSAALYIQAGTPVVRAVLLYVGDFDSRPVATASYPNNFLGTAMQRFRTSLSDVALQHGVALMGIASLIQDRTDDEAVAKIVSSLQDLAAGSGHPELATAPVLLYGVSFAAPVVYRFAHEQPQRTVGFFTWMGVARVPARTTAAQQVPGALILAGEDSLVDNAEVRTWFDANRAEGALWSIGVEPLVLHGPPDAAVTALTVRWMDDVLAQRLPTGTGTILSLQETAGWLGDLASFDIAAHDQFAGAPLSAAWLPTQATAEQWQALVR